MSDGRVPRCSRARPGSSRRRGSGPGTRRRGPPGPPSSAAKSGSCGPTVRMMACAPGRPIPSTVVRGTRAWASSARISASRSWWRAPVRSILLTKRITGMRIFTSVRISNRVCACTPSTAERTSTTPSSTPRARSTSEMKSGWPGVSMRLTLTPPTVKDTTADRMVMPRRRSSSCESVWVSPRSTLPTWSMTPEVCSSRSVRLVLPASTCARIPMVTLVKRCVPWFYGLLEDYRSNTELSGHVHLLVSLLSVGTDP